MPDPREAAVRALSMIRGGVGSPIRALAERAARARMAADEGEPYQVGPATFRDTPQSHLDALDEGDYSAIPGDPYPERDFDPADEGRAAAIDAYNRGPKPGTMPSADMEPDPGDPMEGMEDEVPMRGEPRNAAEAVNDLGPVFAKLAGLSEYEGAPRTTTAPMGERYTAAGEAPRVGATPEEDDEERRIVALLGGR